MVVLQLCRWKFSHKKRNFVAADFIQLKLTFVPKNRKFAFWATLSGLGGNVHTPSIACWKARGRLYIRHNWTFSAISYGWDVISGNRSSRHFSKEGWWVTFSADFRGKRASPTNHCWCQRTRVTALSCGIKIATVHRLVLSQYTHLTHGRTDRQNCDSATVHCITYHTIRMYWQICLIDTS